MLLVDIVLTRTWEMVVPDPAAAPVIFPEMTAGTQLNVVPGTSDVRFRMKVVLEQMVSDVGLFVIFGLELTNRLAESALVQPLGLLTVTL